MVGHGGSSASSYLADPTSPIPSLCVVIILVKKCPNASIVVTSTLRVKAGLIVYVFIDNNVHIMYKLLSEDNVT